MHWVVSAHPALQDSIIYLLFVLEEVDKQPRLHAILRQCTILQLRVLVTQQLLMSGDRAFVGTIYVRLSLSTICPLVAGSVHSLYRVEPSTFVLRVVADEAVALAPAKKLVPDMAPPRPLAATEAQSLLDGSHPVVRQHSLLKNTSCALCRAKY